jgi:hypothetical protein
MKPNMIPISWPTLGGGTKEPCDEDIFRRSFPLLDVRWIEFNLAVGCDMYLGVDVFFLR